MERFQHLTAGGVDVEGDMSALMRIERLGTLIQPAEPIGPTEVPLSFSIAALERAAICRALATVGNNRGRAAKLLGIGERTLYRKIKDYEIRDGEVATVPAEPEKERYGWTETDSRCEPGSTGEAGDAEADRRGEAI